MVQDGSNGLLVERNNSGVFADACTRMLLMDSDEWQSMAKQARARLKAGFGNDLLAEKMEAFIDRIVTGRGE
jgi:hypothetical protein